MLVPRSRDGEPAPRPTLRFAGLGIPEQGRGEFVAAGVAGFAAFSLLGLFAALAPTFVGGVLHQPSHAIQGAVVFLLLAVGAITQLLLSRFNSRRVVMAGLGLFLAALALIVAALSQAGMALFLAGTVVGGVSVGAVFLGSLATANRLAPPGRRGQAISTFFVLCYTGLIIPVVGVGVASGFIGDFRAVLAFSILLAALCTFSLASIRRALLVRTAAASGPPSWCRRARDRYGPDGWRCLLAGWRLLAGRCGQPIGLIGSLAGVRSLARPASAVTPRTAAIGIRESCGSSYRQSKVAMMNGGSTAAMTPIVKSRHGARSPLRRARPIPAMPATPSARPAASSGPGT